MNGEAEVLNEFSNLLNMRNNEQARILLEQFSEKYNSAKVLNNLGWFYMHIGTCCGDAMKPDYLKAVEYLKRAAKMSDNIHQPYTNLGYAYTKLKKYDDAQNALINSVNIEHSIINQNNLAYCLYKNGLYVEAEGIIDILLNEIKNMNIFEIVKKSKYSLNNLCIFVLLYNEVCIKAKLQKYNEIDQTMIELLDCYKMNLIDISDVDILDIIFLYYISGNYEMVVKLFPEQGYSIDEKSFIVYMISLLKQGIEPKQYYEKIISDIKSESEDFSTLAKVKYQDRINNMANIYKLLLKGKYPDINIYPHEIESNYIFF